MIHQLLDDGARHVLHDVTVDHSGDDGDGDDVAALLDDAPDLLVLDADHVLAVDLQQVVIDQQSVAGRRGVHSDRCDLPVLELESNVPGGVLQSWMLYVIQTKVVTDFVQGERPLEGPVPDHHDDVVD